jgi:hypothetical protein
MNDSTSKAEQTHKLMYFHRDAAKDICLADFLNNGMEKLKSPIFYETGAGAILCVGTSQLPIASYAIADLVEWCFDALNVQSGIAVELNPCSLSDPILHNEDISLLTRAGGLGTSFEFRLSESPTELFKVLEYHPESGRAAGSSLPKKKSERMDAFSEMVESEVGGLKHDKKFTIEHNPSLASVDTATATGRSLWEDNYVKEMAHLVPIVNEEVFTSEVAITKAFSFITDHAEAGSFVFVICPHDNQETKVATIQAITVYSKESMDIFIKPFNTCIEVKRENIAWIKIGPNNYTIRFKEETRLNGKEITLITSEGAARYAIYAGLFGS